MSQFRAWAFWRRVQYGTGFGIFWMLIFGFVYMQYLYASPTCFDQDQNGDELGIDCGGGCTRICAFQVREPEIKWARSFRVTEGQYNAVAYIENTNEVAATPEITYTFSLYDEQGLIVERNGKTILPPDSVYPIFEARIDTKGRIPTQTFIALDPPELWLPAEVGRNQFTVSDRQLFNADARPRLEAVILNNALTQAKEVEVVATIFDARGNALTSSRTFIDNFAARSQETAVFTWPEPIAKTVRSCEVPTDVVMAIDLSGSMNNDNDNPPEPITSVLKAAEAFVNRMQSGDQVGLVTFATDAVVARQLSGSLESTATAVAGLTIDPGEEAGSTNTGDAFVRALEELSSQRHSEASRKVLVLLTDGLATAPDEEPEMYARDKAQIVHDAGIEVFTIGLGAQVNMDFVTELATNPVYAYRALGAGDVDRIYRSITAEICEDGAAVIDIVPKTNASFAPLR